VKLIRLLIETNLFIALAAVMFMWSGACWLNIPLEKLVFLSLQVFSSTWFVYQISRWVYFQKGIYTNSEEWVLLWFQQHPKFNRFTIYLSALLTIILTFFLQWTTMIVLLFIGIISVLYTVPVLKPFGIPTRVRDFPYVKIFLIALVWSVTAVILPATEAHFPFDTRRDIWLLLGAQFLFIFFITLPFDINDEPHDKLAGTRTIPVVLSISGAKILTIIIGFIYALMVLYLFMLENWIHLPALHLQESTIIGLWLLILFLQIYTWFRSDTVPKWKIKLVYDGSMMIYFLLMWLPKLR